MSDAEGRWLTYEELGQLTGRTPNGARMFASRRNWPKRSSNRIGERATVLVPTEIAETPSRASHDAERAKVAPLANGTDERAIARAAIDAAHRAARHRESPPRRGTAAFRWRADVQRTCHGTCGDEISDVRRELSDATAAERIARDEAAGLRAELDARKQWGLWRRLRGR